MPAPHFDHHKGVPIIVTTPTQSVIIAQDDYVRSFQRRWSSYSSRIDPRPPFLLTFTALKRLAIHDEGGAFRGRVHDLLVDDRSWRLRYVQTRTGSLFRASTSLFQTTAISHVLVAGRLLIVATTEPINHAENAHLRSLRDMIGFTLATTDSVRAKVTDAVIDVTDWRLGWAVVRMGLWPFAKKRLVTPWHFNPVRWNDGTITSDRTADEIEASPAFDPATPINEQLETALYDYRGLRH